MTTPAREPRIVGLGIACLDYLFVVSQAKPGSQGELVTYAVEGGGLVATALVTSARLGACAEIITWVGDDEAGRFVLNGLRAEQIDVSRAAAVEHGQTAVSFVQVEAEAGERTIYHRRGVEASAEEVHRTLRAGARPDAALVDGVWPEASISFARQMKELGVPVVGDFCPDEARQELAGLVDALIVSQQCSERLLPGGTWQERLHALAAMGPAFEGITAGGDGCYWLAGGEVMHQPAFRAEVVDTTGAGDVFHGAFAYGLARGWAYERCTEFAAAAAALSCRALGGRKGIPKLREVERMVAKGVDRMSG